MVEILIIVVFTGALGAGVFWLQRHMAERAAHACSEAARLLRLQPLGMTRDGAAAVFLGPDRRVHSDVLAFSGSLSGTEVVIATFRHDSNTAMNGVLIPITATHVVAKLRHQLTAEPCEVGRRVFGMPDSSVRLGPPLDESAVILTTDPGGVEAVLRGNTALATQIVSFLKAGSGSAFVFQDRCATMVAHPDATKIREAARAAAGVARALDRAIEARRMG